ncbi:MAG: sel1 repeat family protein [Candidatus Eremiobacteraeota bacterium]|nr:sel1 repeat family protein [Candidatus Eremiobacteraeota bacterium]
MLEMRGGQRDVSKAKVLLESALADGDARAAYALGSWCIDGDRLPRDLERARALFSIAAEAKIGYALFDLAIMTEKGEGGVRDLRKAFELYVDAALHGDTQSVFEVGRCYRYGIGIAEDHALAEIWRDRAEELGVYDPEDDEDNEIDTRDEV